MIHFQARSSIYTLVNQNLQWQKCHFVPINLSQKREQEAYTKTNSCIEVQHYNLQNILALVFAVFSLRNIANILKFA